MLEIAYLLPYEEEYGKWHKSKDKKGGISPFPSVMINKKWWLEEYLNNHILQFQQVNDVCRLCYASVCDVPGRFSTERSKT